MIIARNVIPHVEHIHSIIRGFKNLSKKDGIIAIEFHYLYEIIKGLHYDSIYHEHLYYFSLKSISNLFQNTIFILLIMIRSPISSDRLFCILAQIKK